MVIVAMVKIGNWYTMPICLFSTNFVIWSYMINDIIIAINEYLRLIDASSLSELNYECPGSRNTTEEHQNVSI